ncbi:MAG: phospholipase [bacterium]|nr:phospholipase [bacterium]
MIEEHHLRVQRTARYFTLGHPSAQTNCLVIACHGYGQLAKHFIKKFDVIARPDTLVVAPEGLSRFYWGGLSGNVVASWMTKEDRLAEIADFSAYLTRLYEHFTSDLPANAKIILLGFSQGCATQLRWMAREKPAFSHLVLWAGSIPEDIDYTPARSCLQDKPLHFVYGVEDPFITPERIAAQQALAAQLPMAYQVHTFEGKHTVEREALRRLFEQIRP